MSPRNGGPGGRKGPRFATRTQLWPRGRPVGPWVGQDHAPGLEGPEMAHAVVGSRIGKNWEKMGKKGKAAAMRELWLSEDHQFR